MESPPLTDVRVLEVGNYMAGPFCGMQLADLGAEVIKIEQPDGGDQVRLAAPFVDGQSSPFVRLNRNKRSLVLDLKSARGKEVFRRLADTADVVVGVPVCDLVCALYGALAAVSALRARERTGRGQHIDVSLFEAGVSLGVWEAGKYFATGEIARPLG